MKSYGFSLDNAFQIGHKNMRNKEHSGLFSLQNHLSVDYWNHTCIL